MSPSLPLGCTRYVVRRQDNAKYRVCDRETDAVVVNEYRELSNLGFDEALDEAEKLNDPHWPR